MAGIQALQRIKFSATPAEDIPQALDRFQDSVDGSIRQIRKCPLIDGVLITNQVASYTAPLTADKVAVLHGLGRDWQGYIITRCTGAVSFYEDISNDTIDRSAQLRMRTVFHPGSPTTVSYDIWVF